MKTRFIQYIQERFSISSNLLIILLLYLSLYIIAGMKESSIVFSYKTLFGFLTMFTVFFRIRIFDDIKDYNMDTELLSQFITLKKLKLLVIPLIGIEALFSALISTQAFLFYLIVLVYTLIMFFDFFIHEPLVKNRLIYNFVHQTFIFIWPLYVYVIYHNTIQTITKHNLYLGFLIVLYFIMGLVEIIRKLRGPDHPYSFRSYVHTLGRKKFSIYVLGMVFPATIITGFILPNITLNAVFYLVYGIVSLSVVLLTILFTKERVNRVTIRAAYVLFIIATLSTIILSILISKPIAIAC